MHKEIVKAAAAMGRFWFLAHQQKECSFCLPSILGLIINALFPTPPHSTATRVNCKPTNSKWDATRMDLPQRRQNLMFFGSQSNTPVPTQSRAKGMIPLSLREAELSVTESKCCRNAQTTLKWHPTFPVQPQIRPVLLPLNPSTKHQAARPNSLARQPSSAPLTLDAEAKLSAHSTFPMCDYGSAPPVSKTLLPTIYHQELPARTIPTARVDVVVALVPTPLGSAATPL